jgi:ATP-binding cassette subfamily B protein
MGKTGAGKTTITELLTRVYDVTEGEILIDGVNIKKHNLNLLRERTAVVTQDTFLFSDTVQSNIAFGDDGATEETVKEYADYASVLEDIEKLPQTFHTLVGERGVTLSGGQKQRISIARAFIKNPDIVILDDALSAVDTNTEQNILNYFEQSLKDKTSIIITHRANNLLNYNKILILEDGKIVQSGTHAELLSQEGFYKSVFERQNAHMV